MVTTSPIMTKVYAVTEWLMKLALLNILWLICSLPIITLFPSTNALFATLRANVRGEVNGSLSKTFFHLFKWEFGSSYRIGLFMLFIGFILYVHLQFALTGDTSVFLIYRYVVYMFILLFVVALMYVYPVAVHITMPAYKAAAMALFLGIRHIFWTLTALVTMCIILFLLYQFQAFVLLFSGSVIAGLMTSIAHLLFERSENKQIIQ
ncbi:YesL family protein [Alteribacillus sp. HJP-4]|uniref:YesL family protein n=1 Tax=Alteribacillus sp. HJP-4 TaxID=2775394 RepID=UPI0035CCFEC2